jgi:redox-regulated HSP33 family molecular chaperone
MNRQELKDLESEWYKAMYRLGQSEDGQIFIQGLKRNFIDTIAMSADPYQTYKNLAEKEMAQQLAAYFTQSPVELDALVLQVQNRIDTQLGDNDE